MGVALQTVIPKMIHKKITAFFELIKPLVEFKVRRRSHSRCLLCVQSRFDFWTYQSNQHKKRKTKNSRYKDVYFTPV